MESNYYPILRIKAGEMWALSHLPDDVVGSIVPIFEITLHDEKKTNPTDHVKKSLANVAKHWKRPFYLDISAFKDKKRVMQTAIKTCIDSELKFTLVIESRPTEQAIQVVAKYLTSHEDAAVMLRCPAVETPRRLRLLLQQLGRTEPQCDYLMDYKAEPMRLVDGLLDMCSPEKWRTLIASSAMFNVKISSLGQKVWHRFERSCWTSWLDGVNSEGIERKPAFSDYATRSLGDGTGGRGKPAANIRYTIDKQWAVIGGKKLADGGSEDMRELCDSLLNQDFYSGPEYSTGDLFFSEVSHERETPGGAVQWVQWSLNHHLVKVVRDLRAVSFG
jgi:Beta protein